MSSALVVRHDLSAPAYEVIPAAMATHAEAILALAAPIVITDAASAEQANAVMLQLHNVCKEVSNHGEKIKRPLNQLLKAVRDCIERAEGPLTTEKQVLQGKIAAWDRKLKAEIAEAQAKADAERKAAEAAAAAETKRLQDEANAAAAKLQREREAKAAADAKALEELIGTPVVAEVVAPVAPVVVAPVKVQAPTTVVPVAAESSVVIKKVSKLEIYDPKALAAAYCIAGEVVVDFREGLINKLLDAGVVVPGARRIIVEQVAQRGTR